MILCMCSITTTVPTGEHTAFSYSESMTDLGGSMRTSYVHILLRNYYVISLTFSYSSLTHQHSQSTYPTWPGTSSDGESKWASDLS